MTVCPAFHRGKFCPRAKSGPGPRYEMPNAPHRGKRDHAPKGIHLGSGFRSSSSAACASIQAASCFIVFPSLTAFLCSGRITACFYSTRGKNSSFFRHMPGKSCGTFHKIPPFSPSSLVDNPGFAWYHTDKSGTVQNGRATIRKEGKGK